MSKKTDRVLLDAKPLPFCYPAGIGRRGIGIYPGCF